MVTVIQLYPKLFAWFRGFAWLRRLTRRWRKPKKTFTFDSVETVVEDQDYNVGIDFKVLDITSAAATAHKTDNVDYEVIDTMEHPW